MNLSHNNNLWCVMLQFKCTIHNENTIIIENFMNHLTVMRYYLYGFIVIAR